MVSKSQIFVPISNFISLFYSSQKCCKYLAFILKFSKKQSRSQYLKQFFLHNNFRNKILFTFTLVRHLKLWGILGSSIVDMKGLLLMLDWMITMHRRILQTKGWTIFWKIILFLVHEETIQQRKVILKLCPSIFWWTFEKTGSWASTTL